MFIESSNVTPRFLTEVDDLIDAPASSSLISDTELKNSLASDYKKVSFILIQLELVS